MILPIRRFTGALAAAGIALCAASYVHAEAAPAKTITVQDSETKQIIEVTPTTVLPVPPLPLGPAPGQAPFVPIGYDLGATDAPGKSPAEAPEGAPLKFNVYWRLNAQAPQSAALHMRLAGSGPAHEQTVSIDTAGWKMGGAYRTSLLFTPKGGRYAGAATLALSLQATPTAPEIPLLTIPITVLPVRAPSSLADDRVREAFGPGAVRLLTAFRLGKGARVTVPVPPDAARAYSGVGFVSAVGYAGFFESGATVLRITCETAASERETLTLLYGKDTLQGETKTTQPSDRKLEGVEIFAADEPVPGALPRHTFVGRLPFSKPRQVESVQLEYAPPTGVLDIAEIVLLP